MHILLTRPEPDASACRAQLEAIGHRVTTEPLLRIEPLAIAGDALDGAGTLVVTSRNGLRSLAAAGMIMAAQRLPLIAVGPGTRDLAEKLGFTDVSTGPGTGAELMPLILERARATRAPLAWIRGNEAAFDLAGAAAAAAVELRSIVAYRAIEAGRLDPATRQLLESGELGGVILMSPRTAAIFVRLVGQAGVAESSANLVFFSLSPAVAAALEPLRASRVEIAENPNSASMLSIVTRVATLSSGV